MNSNSTHTALAVTALVAVGLSLLFAGAFMAGSDVERSRAIKAGVAYWTINESSGETKFVYGVKPKEKNEN